MQRRIISRVRLEKETAKGALSSSTYILDKIELITSIFSTEFCLLPFFVATS